MKRHYALQMITVAGLLLAMSGARADPTFEVSLDTSAISGTSEQLVFEFVDGDGSVNNSVSLSDFTLGGGAAAAPADYMGSTGVSGDVASGITMDDSGGTALFTQLVTFGSSLMFRLNTTNVFSGSGAPDALSMAVYTSNFSACYSDDQIGCTLLELDLTGNALAPSSFTLHGASAQGLPAPVVTLATPEPASLLLLAAGFAGLTLTRTGARHPKR
jgi:hypothetical protein